METALALDLGTTNVKAAKLEGGRLADLVSVPAPALEGDGLGRTCRAGDYLAAIDACTEGLTPVDAPLGVSAQRSTFLLFDAADGRPLTPLISWQDRGAAAWCAARATDAPWIHERTGLPLSPHYAGPKLACLLAERPALRAKVQDGSARFGTLETWWLFLRGARRPFVTDVSMAARTLLADPRRGAWDDELLAYFDVPPQALPAIRGTQGRDVRLAGGHVVAASVADQAAGAYAVLGDDEADALVNLGTGGFVLRVTGTGMAARPGYLAGPLRGVPDSTDACHAIEGTVNGIGEALARSGGAPARLPEDDPEPDAFCVPDLTGLGSPHWRPDHTLAFSPAARRQPADARGRFVLEGICFRVREILEDLCPDAAPRRVFVAGGLAREPVLSAALAACLGRAVRVLDEPEVTLWGAAGLAGGRSAGHAAPPSHVVEPGRAGRYLAAKHRAWRAWLAHHLRA